MEDKVSLLPYLLIPGFLDDRFKGHFSSDFFEKAEKMKGFLPVQLPMPYGKQYDSSLSKTSVEDGVGFDMPFQVFCVNHVNLRLDGNPFKELRITFESFDSSDLGGVIYNFCRFSFNLIHKIGTEDETSYVISVEILIKVDDTGPVKVNFKAHNTNAKLKFLTEEEMRIAILANLEKVINAITLTTTEVKS